MKPLVLEEIVDREKYAELRTSYRTAVIDYKRSRRLAVGENITLLFEDYETLRFQVQEMVWVEGIALPEKIQHEIDTYNELMPADHELSATLFIEITEAAKIRAALDRLIGVDEHVSLIVGDEHEAIEIDAQFDPKQMEEDRIPPCSTSNSPSTKKRSDASAIPIRSRACGSATPTTNGRLKSRRSPETA